MSRAPSDTTCGSPACAAASHQARSGREDATGQFIGELGGSQVEHAGERPGPRERFERTPPGPVGVEDHDVVAELFEPGSGSCHAWRGDAEHACRNHRPRRTLRQLNSCRGNDRRGGVGEDPRRDRVQPRDVGDRVGHRDVAGAHVLPDVSRGHGRNHDLGDADRQCSHGAGGDIGASGAAQRYQPVQPAVREQPAADHLGSLAHHRHGLTAIGQARELMSRGVSYLGSRNVGRHGGRPAGAHVDQDCLGAKLVHSVPDELVLGALGVQRAEQHDGGHRGAGLSAARATAAPRVLSRTRALPAEVTSSSGSRDPRCWSRDRASGWLPPCRGCRSGSRPARTCAGRQRASPSSRRTSRTPPEPGWVR